MIREIFQLPSWRDPRYLQVSIHILYAMVARFLFNFESSYVHFFIPLIYCVALDALVSRLVYRKPNHVLTSMIVACGCCLMIYSPSIWPYIGAITVGVLGKAFVRFEGRHVFNPSNLGVVTMLAFFPNWAVTSGNLFSGYWGPSIVFLVLGSINVIWARQATIAFVWLGAFTLFNYLRGVMTDSVYPLSLLVLNPLLLMYTFHMITDPSTTPKTRIFRFIFPVLVALADVVMRYYSIIGAQFFALFLITCFMPFVRTIEERVWPGSWNRMYKPDPWSALRPATAATNMPSLTQIGQQR